MYLLGFAARRTHATRWRCINRECLGRTEQGPIASAATDVAVKGLLNLLPGGVRIVA